MNLHEYFLNNNQKLIHKWIHYFDIYEKHFRRYVNKKMLIIEIGVYKGGSLEMWKKYFGEESTIVGIDIDPDCKKHENAENNVFVEIGDQSDVEFLQFVIDKYGRPDILLDDGSHVMSHILTTFEKLYFQVKDDGIYLVEDLHTCYFGNQYEGGLNKENTFIEYTKRKIDELNSPIVNNDVLPITNFAKKTQSICIYDSIVVFEKRVQSSRQALKIGMDL